MKNILQKKQLGFGTAPLGNMFRNIPEEEALATVDAAWENGVRYFDSAPFYGAGLAELRLGEALAKRPRDEYVLSTKVGRIILDELEDPTLRDLGEKGGLFEYGRKNKLHVDYSEDGTLRSIEDSLKRLQTDRLVGFNEKERHYTYSIMQAPFPVTNYESTIHVRENGDKGTLVEWSGEFTPVGVSDDEAIKLFHGIYSDGLEALKKAFQA